MNKVSDDIPFTLSIDTSCDETAAAVTKGCYVLSNVVWSQASQHAKFGGVMPSLAQRMHEDKIDWVIDRAISKAGIAWQEIGSISVTSGPGLAIALGVGINKAKELADKYSVPIEGINHVEGHLLSPLAMRKKANSTSPDITEYNNCDAISFPAFGLVVSGGHTELVNIVGIGKYRILAQTQDDALGEALDKAARMLGLGYPGGAILEKMAKLGNASRFQLPLPMARQRINDSFSYSGLKTALYRLIETAGPSLDRQHIYDLAACFQNRAFQHLERIVDAQISVHSNNGVHKFLLAGGGVLANLELRKRLRLIAKKNGLKLMLPYSKNLIGDNAAMIGVTTALRSGVRSLTTNSEVENIDRKPRWSVEDV